MKETAYDPAGDNKQSPAPGMAATDTHNPATPVQPKATGNEKENGSLPSPSSSEHADDRNTGLSSRS